MKIINKKTIVLLTTFVLFLSDFSMVSSAQTAGYQLLPMTMNYAEDNKQQPFSTFAQVTGWRYKSENGRVYRRQYNYSRRKWIGEWELC